jgi:hypothetical protein
MKISENNLKKFVGIKFEYGKCSMYSCDCFGLFLLILKEHSQNQELYNSLHNVFYQSFYNQLFCFEKMNKMLLHCKTNSHNNHNTLVVIQIKNRLHCGIIFLSQGVPIALHSLEKHGVVLTSLERFFEIGTEIARFELDTML